MTVVYVDSVNWIINRNRIDVNESMNKENSLNIEINKKFIQELVLFNMILIEK